jgi:GDP-mannose 6-dehydrogenase
LRALVYSARQADLQLPLLESVLPSNERHLQRAFEAVVALGRKRVGIFGLSFKEGTDDLRESPLVELSERLIGKGFDLRIHDPAVSLSALVGSNREFIEERIPHLSALLVSSPQELMDHAEVCVIGAKTEDAVRAVSAREDRIVVDLVRVPGLGSGKEGGDGYIGIAW